MANRMPKNEDTQRDEASRSTRSIDEIALGQSVSGEGYVRLRLRYDQGDLSVVRAKRVAGPLLQPQRLQAGFVYEVLRGSRRLSAESIPDLGIQRSFSPPEGEETSERQGHHIVELETYEFNVRIPANEFTRRNLRSLHIALLQTGEPQDVSQLDTRPLTAQSRGLRQVGQLNLKDIRLDQLPNDVRKQIEEAMR